MMNENAAVDTLKAEISKGFQTIIAGCASEQKAANKALQRVKDLNKKIEDLETSIQDKQAEAEALRGEITDLVAAGKDASKPISKRTTLLAEVQVLQDIIEDIREEKIPAAEGEACSKLGDFQGKAVNDLYTLRQTYQARISQLAGDMADLIEAWSNVLDDFVNSNGSVVRGMTSAGSPFTTNRMWLRFPDISVDDRPERILVRIERGEI